MNYVALVLIAASVSFGSPTAAAERSSVQKAEFKRQHPCPITGRHRGACPGYIIDHVVPLCAGGLDAPGNMQWQTVDVAKIKDRDERRQCRTSRH